MVRIARQPRRHKRDPRQSEPAGRDEKTAGRQKFEKINIDFFPFQQTLGSVQQSTFVRQPNDWRRNGAQKMTVIRPTNGSHKKPTALPGGATFRTADWLGLLLCCIGNLVSDHDHA